MKPAATPFTAIYTEWMKSFLALIPGGSRAGPAEALPAKAAQAAAVHEWEHEGGSIKPAPGVEAAPKIPF